MSYIPYHIKYKSQKFDYDKGSFLYDSLFQ